MTDMRKITVFLPADLLESCQQITGKGVSETIRTALADLVHHAAREELLAAMGHLDLEADGLTLQDLRDESPSLPAHHAA
jgi:metal-responsive CopG/Arc/MetJ family transcriptional regulator